jgi:endoglucanase
VSVFREAGATYVRWVWSPAGEPGARAYYPGDDMVDYVGLTVLGDARWDWDMGYQTPRSMADILRPRYAEVADLGKPVLLAEVGTSGTPEVQQEWLQAGLDNLRQFDRVRGVVYFDDRNAPNNHQQTEPDWRLTSNGLTTLATTTTKVTA